MKLQKSLMIGGVAFSFFSTNALAASDLEKVDVGIQKVDAKEYKDTIQKGQNALDDLIFWSLTVRQYDALEGESLENIKSNAHTFLTNICPREKSIKDKATQGTVRRTCHALRIRMGQEPSIDPVRLTESDVDALLASAKKETAQTEAHAFYERHFMMFTLEQPKPEHIEIFKENAKLFSEKVCSVDNLKSSLSADVFNNTSFQRSLRRICAIIEERERNDHKKNDADR